MVIRKSRVDGPRHEISIEDDAYPLTLLQAPDPPEKLYVIGDPQALMPGLAVVGARKATPYGKSCARRFALLAAQQGVTIISGGARGCDSIAHEAALEAGTPTVSFLGGGLNQIYPIQNVSLFQRIVDAGGAIVSEQPWEFEPLPFTFRLRNRLIAGLAKATLIVEAGLPSGTFSTADAALATGHDVLVVPGAITSTASRGANQLLLQGAYPVIDDESFSLALFSLFGCLIQERITKPAKPATKALETKAGQALLAALDAEVLCIEQLLSVATPHLNGEDSMTWLIIWLAEAQRDGLIAQYPDGRYGPCLHQL